MSPIAPATSISELEPKSRMSMHVHDGSTQSARFAIVRFRGVVCLVQIIGHAKPSRKADPTTRPFNLSIFRHEFISMWQYSHTAQLLPADFRVLLLLDANAVRYEEDSGIVFLAKHVMSHLKDIMDESTRPKETQRYLAPGRWPS